MNTVILIGRLTKDPEIRVISQSETTVANFTLAVDRPMAKEKTADFIRIVCFGKTAELCERFLTKGRQVAVHGRIQTGSYKTQSGETRYTTEVVAERVEFLGSKGDSSPKEVDSSIPDGFSELDDDVPF
ncbi:MAG: single-stranded DNA-binding protein [Eubacteriales bacterium]|nr:single-stranded DNA-binding protein [Eubacteriales bacterium]